MMNDYRGYLSHHGILGMKWGKRNGPPYPLSGSAHSSSEKKAGWKKSLGGGRNENLYGRKTLVGGSNSGFNDRKLQKKRDLLNKASKYTNEAAREAEIRYKEFADHEFSKEYAKKYLDGKKGQERWLQDAYGDDWKNKKYMKEVFEIDDVYKHAKEEIQSEYKDSYAEEVRMTPLYKQRVDEWLKRTDIFMNTPVTDLSKKDLKEAKKFAHKQAKIDRSLKRSQKRNGS